MFLRRLLFSVCALLVVPAHAQYNWQADAQTATRQNLWGIACGGNALVAVGEGGTILYSDYDGVAWQTRPSGLDVWLVGVGYGNNRWIAVGDQGVILVSDDNGDTWLRRPSGTVTRLNNVIYGNGRWLVVGEQGSVLTSTDNGETWTVRAVPEPGFLRALAFGQGQFLFGGAGGVLYTTTDGAAFTRVPIATTANIEAAAITAGRIFVSGSNGMRATTTALGAAWTIHTSTFDGTFRGLVARAADDAAVGGDVSTLVYVNGGWTSTGLRPGFLITAMAPGRDEAIAVGFGGGISRSSSLYNVTVVPRGNNVAAYSGTASATYGTDVRLTAVLGGTATNVALQWQRDNVDIPGATEAELVLPAIRPEATASYSVRARTGATTVRAGGLLVSVVPAGRPPIIDPDFNFALGSAPSVIRFQSNGRILALGTYSGVPGSTESRLVRLHRDGSIDATFRFNASGSITRIAVLPDDRIYVLGASSVDGQTVPGLARLNADGTLDRTFAPDNGDRFNGQLLLAPNGDVYVGSQNAATLVRLTASGARDSSFTPLPAGHTVFAIDAEQRLLAHAPVTTPPMLWTYPGLIRRFLPSGALDGSYELNFTNRTVGVVVGNQLYGISSLYGRFGASRSFFRLTAAGLHDSSYVSPAGTPYPEINLEWSALYGADGTLWDFRRPGAWGRPLWASRYHPNGVLDTSQSFELPDNYGYTPLAIEPAGTLLAARRASYVGGTGTPEGPPLVRLRPLNTSRARLGNLSVRSQVASADSPLIAGFVSAGTGETRVLVRAVGPGLAPFGINDAMADPQLRVVADGVTIATNDQWPADLAPRFAASGAFALPAASRDAALETSIGAGNYSAVVTPAPGSAPGTALLEVYETATAAPRRLINLSARGPVAPGSPLIVGFNITGDSPTRILVRGVGPTLGALGVGGVLANPRLTLYRAGAALFENDDWSRLNPTQTTSTAGTGAFVLASTSADAAMLVTLAPGSYTAVVEGAAGATGTALAEIYEAP